MQTLIFDDQINSHKYTLNIFKYDFGYYKWTVDELFAKLVLLFKYAAQLFLFILSI